MVLVRSRSGVLGWSSRLSGHFSRLSECLLDDGTKAKRLHAFLIYVESFDYRLSGVASSVSAGAVFAVEKGSDNQWPRQ